MLDVEDIISKLTEEEKCGLIAAVDWWHTLKIERLGVPKLRFSDGPNGVRGQRHFNSTKTTCFPAATGLAATWNKNLIHKVGSMLSEECKLKGARLLLGPTINIARGPLGGRAFESFSEDPVLSGLLAASYINGVQTDTGIACSLKHFICNDQEFERNSQDSIVSERALREIYALPFQLAIRDSNPLSIMTSYNRMNGVHCSEDPHLLQDILRNEWGWDGFVISDWQGTYSTVEAIKAGLDLEAPGPSLYRKTLVSAALKAKKLDIKVVEDRCRAVLQLINNTESSGIPEDKEEEVMQYTDSDINFLQQLTSEGIVLLKKDGSNSQQSSTLPFSKTKKTAVIGFNAAYTAYAGGGSSLCKPSYKVSPLQAIQSKIGGATDNNVKYEPGAYSFKFLPSLGDTLRTDNTGKTVGASIKVYNHPPSYPLKKRELVDELILDDIGYFRMNDYFNDKFHDRTLFWADIDSVWYPEQTGTYLLGIAVFGTAKLYIDGELIVDNATVQEPGTAFYGQGAKEVRSRFYAEAGKAYKFHIEFGANKTSKLTHLGPPIGGGGGLICGGILDISAEEAITKAVQAATECEQCVVICGLNKEWESEGSDRPDMKLPPHNDELIKAVLKANPNAVVIIQSGSPIDMSAWVDDCQNLFHCSYGGNETGNGIANCLFGDVNPCGKLPLSFPLKIEDNPTYLNWCAERGKVLYGEGVYVGYRYYEKLGKEVLFPFGYGLSYTSFKFEDLKITVDEEADLIEVSLLVKNIGSVDGAEVVQVYISPNAPSIKRPLKELKEFTKVFVKAGDVEEVKLEISLKYATSFWDESVDGWISEKDQYEVIVSDSSDRGNTSVSDMINTTKTFTWNGI